MCVFIFLLTLIVTPTLSANVHVFLIAGQSNSVGLNSDGFTENDSSNERIFQLSCCKANGSALPPMEDCRIIMASEPLHHFCLPEYLSLETIGFGMTFARQFVKHIPYEEVVVLVPAGFPGTGFFDNIWNAYEGQGFLLAVSKLQRTFDILQNVSSSFDGILWHQGENEAGDNVDGQVAGTSVYLNQFIVPMIEAFRNQTILPFTNSTLPFVCANLLPSWGMNPAHEERQGVWNAIALLDQYVPYSACAPSQGLQGDLGWLSSLNGELIHFTAASQRILGRRYYAAWQLAKENVPDGKL